jgi:hypothetical protein
MHDQSLQPTSVLARLYGRVRPLDLRQMKRAVSVIAVFVELVVLGYAMLMAFLITVWIETDSFAVRATEIDWWIEGGKRLFVVVIAAAIFAVILLPVNKVFFRWLGFKNRHFASYFAGAAFLLIVTVGITGEVNFAITKPFI